MNNIVLERAVSLNTAERKIDSFFKNKNININIKKHGKIMSSTVANIKIHEKNTESCIGCGKGYDDEARVGAKYEAYEHQFGLKYLREKYEIKKFNDVINQKNFSKIFPLQILEKDNPEKISTIPFKDYDNINGYNFNFPSFLIDYNYEKVRLKNDDCNYIEARRYSCGTGLASGYNFTEAAIHAISEVIERHTVGCFLASHFFYQTNNNINIINNTEVNENLAKIINDAEKSLNDKITIVNIGLNKLPPVFIAYCNERKIINKINVFGAGCSYYPELAITRAVKELVQQHSIETALENVKDEWQDHYNHISKYPKLLRCFVANMKDMKKQETKIPKKKQILDLDSHLNYLLNKCNKAELPVWIKELKEEEEGISIASAIMPQMERFSIISLGNFIIPLYKNEKN